jgi:hypothetical protein
MLTDFAVMVPFLDVPVTVRQSPTATEESEVVTVWENEVEAVQSTVVWPDCSLWTSIELPEMAATDPEVPGPPGAPPGEAAPAVPATPRQAARERQVVAARTERRWYWDMWFIS